MEKRVYRVIQIGKWLLEEPIFMCMDIVKGKKDICLECGDDIDVNESYWYDPNSDSETYCVSCIGVEGDPYDILSEEIPKYKDEE